MSTRPGSLPLRRARGFTMIEVLVSLFIIATALFGMVKLQAMTVRSTYNSSTRSLVALQAASLAASMHANAAFWNSSAVPATVASFTVGGSSGTTTVDSSLANSGNSATTCTSASCTPLNLASNDLYLWLQSLANAVPTSGANVSCTAPTSVSPVTCLIDIDWVEKTVAQSGSVGSNGSTSNLSYQLIVVP